ncbi:phosphorothioated DNA-binding restriction endonuclease [Vibrio parahaemolyticus]|uniref:phosphorothioated DNA-binding restriction endonuclease n=1 Tax=Vibrio parahaemolyticus TaxID=670 RepID=UPI00111F6E77|nr:HNH endonuclease [Vibrio parahaemolyticus]TOJ48013.1 restriction endonuclease [Vibrio parahaemolyticus]HAS6739045.1 restriction endonuclease [Vibrio parahaemolyticus]HAS6753632.1 restriction endonuclease [Vibrio parahaemolyticus]HAS6772574.1 restriction endonuclease [Vibrio parahaemolyticus]
MELIDKIQTISRWRRGDQRAPHKPLMLLYALSQYKQGHERLFKFESEVDDQVKELLVQYGPSRKAYHSEYPFWRLANEKDPFWELKNGEECIPRKSNKDPKKSELIKYNVMAGFDASSYQSLISDPTLIEKIASKLIQDNFPDSLQEELFVRFGFEVDTSTKLRDPNFRKNVLRAYNYRCAVCGFDLALDTVPVGIEAAHIKWKQYSGSCEVSNGIALCSIHHKALDRGVIAFDSELKVKVSPAVTGGNMVERLIWAYESQSIALPRHTPLYPSQDALEWHVREVFKS